MQGVCVSCGLRPQRKRGKQGYASICNRCHATNYREKKYLQYKKDVCEDCGFVPVHPCQLDVDHIDGNHKNDNPLNLKTLCANCHRLKTMLNSDWRVG